MSEQAPQPDRNQPLWLQQLIKSLGEGNIVFGPINHSKRINPLDSTIFVNRKGGHGKTEFPHISNQPLSPWETKIARMELGMSEQEVEKLSRFSSKKWLGALGVEYPKDWE
jgi:hypothetical protein